MRRMRFACCARAANGQAIAEPAVPSNAMKVRRLTDTPHAGVAYHVESGSVHRGKSGSSMSALGQKQTLGKVRLMSALPQKRTLIERVGMSALCQQRTFRRVLDIIVGGKGAQVRGASPVKLARRQFL